MLIVFPKDVGKNNLNDVIEQLLYLKIWLKMKKLDPRMKFFSKKNTNKLDSTIVEVT